MHTRLVRAITIAAVSGTGLFVSPSVSYAQGGDIGQGEYFNSCATCHGEKGKGDGPLAGLLKKPATDLTKIQRDNAGVFPFDRLYQIIDGREPAAAHGPRNMPVWGDRFKREAEGLLITTPNRADSLVRGRILALIGYLYTLQAK
jgi:mono/diheme cytochrome c family protein